MKSGNTFVIISLVCIFGIVSGDENSTPGPPPPFGTVSFFSRKVFQGFSYEDDYTPGCHKLLPYFRQNIGSINTNGKCIQVYRSRLCGDDYKVINVGTPFHYDLSGLQWTSGSTLNSTVNSWKPCMD